MFPASRDRSSGAPRKRGWTRGALCAAQAEVSRCVADGRVSRVREGRVVDLMMEICRADSAPLKEGPVFHIVKRALIELGFEVHEDERRLRLGGEVGNLIATKPGQGGGEGWPPVMFSAHLDRVEGGTGVRPRVVDGRVRSDGSTILGADDAAGRSRSSKPAGRWRKAALRGPHRTGAHHRGGDRPGRGGPRGPLPAQEQDGVCPGRRRAGGDHHHRGADPVHHRSGVLRPRRPAGMAPERGISAIKMAALAVSRMRLGRIDADTTANVGYIAGGGATNIVPERATIRAEARSLERERVERQVAPHDPGHRRGGPFGGGQRPLERTVRVLEGFRLDPDAEPVRRAVRAAKSLGLAPRLKSTGGGSDANIFNAKGIPTRCWVSATRPSTRGRRTCPSTSWFSSPGWWWRWHVSGSRSVKEGLGAPVRTLMGLALLAAVAAFPLVDLDPLAKVLAGPAGKWRCCRRSTGISRCSASG